MDKAIEIVRRLLQAITWVVGGCITVFCAAFYFDTDKDELLYFALGAAAVTIALSKLVNWIFLKDE